MAKADKVTFKEFRNRYGTEDACWKVLFRLRFPEGFICPRYGFRECYPIHSATPGSAVFAAIRPQ